MSEWLPITEATKLDYYKVLFDGGGEAIASLTPRGWVLIEQSVSVGKDADIVAYKHLSKADKEKIKFNIERGKKGFF